MIAGQNIGMIATRQTKDTWDILATASLIGHKAMAGFDINYLFPLYLYPPSDTSKPALFEEHPLTDAPGGRWANLAPGFVAEASQRLGLAWVPDGRGTISSPLIGERPGERLTFGPEDLFHYMYAVFHSPTYRARYAEFLKTDFPRLPLTDDVALFRALCGLGAELTALHLMDRAAPNPPGYPVGGENRVEQVRYTAPGEAGGGALGRVWINATQYFDGVEPETWAFHIGGYQVAQKWLKDRKGRTLSYDDITHYQRTIAALSETQRLMSATDEVIEEHGGWPLDGEASPTNP